MPISQTDRDRLEDLGLVDDDNTPEMRRAPAVTEALRNEPLPGNHHNHTERKF